MKKMISIILIGVLAIGFGALSFADAFGNPAETYSNLAGITVAEAYELKGADQTFGDLAKESGFWDDFVAATLAGKIAIVEARLADGTLTQEEADEIIAQINDCDGSGESALGKLYNLAFGRKGETKGNYGEGEAQMKGSMNEDAPRNGTPQARTAEKSGEMSGTGNRFGQKR
ncbi:MAG: hypothetical protein U9Q80_00220 [Bacillota bacterium]|nr:hypothetical protein [Bacillota bacterium]